MAAPPVPDEQEAPIPSPGHRASSRRLWYTLAVVVGVVLLLRVAEPLWLRRAPQQGDAPITKQSDLQKLAEEHLFYPGAVLLGSGGSDYEQGIWGSNPAQLGHTLGVAASKEEVFAFYDRELMALGWQKTTGMGVGTAEIEVVGWRKERVIVRVAILLKNDPRNLAAINAYQTSIPAPKS